MGATVDGFKATHQAAAGLLGQIDSSSGQQRIDNLSALKDALLAHVGEENEVIKEAMGKADADDSFKTAGQTFLDELGNIAQTALLPFFDKYSSADAVDSDEFTNDFGGIKGALADRIAFEEGKFYPELERLGY
ncbi:MAG: hemerythrin domain-containing protein [Candidatus Scalinduaceae bacterium]